MPTPGLEVIAGDVTASSRSLRLGLAALGSLLAAGVAVAQDADPAQMEQGAALYADSCALCHGAEGEGQNGIFPALAASPVLEDPAVIISSVHQGIVNMPPFPWLTDEEVAALATYVRNSFGNSHGGVEAADVAALRAELGPSGEIRTIWDGVFTQEQADRGEEVARGACGMCHGSRLNGVPDDADMSPAPPLARHKFLTGWEGRPLGAAFTYSHLTMPLSNPGMLPEEDYAAVVAYMLSASGAPAGDAPLSTDPVELGHIRIEPE